jgi:hypothetical protein
MVPDARGLAVLRSVWFIESDISGVPRYTARGQAATMLAVAGARAYPSCQLSGVYSALFESADWARLADLCWRMKHREQCALMRGRLEVPSGRRELDGHLRLATADASRDAVRSASTSLASSPRRRCSTGGHCGRLSPSRHADRIRDAGHRARQRMR